jgi:hypothetical protein
MTSRPGTSCFATGKISTQQPGFSALPARIPGWSSICMNIAWKEKHKMKRLIAIAVFLAGAGVGLVQPVMASEKVVVVYHHHRRHHHHHHAVVVVNR